MQSTHQPADVGISRRKIIQGLACLSPILVNSQSAFGQQRWTQSMSGSCSFYPTDTLDAEIYTFGSVQEAIQVVSKITEAAGLQPNFEVLQANVPNAAAVIRNSTRVILYSQVFIQNIIQQTATQWAAWTIMAHEVGHHLNGHTLTSEGSRPPIELQADRFAGFAVARMGASLEQAQTCYRQMGEAGSPTHPARSARLEAVTAGWQQGKGNTPPPNTAPPSSDPQSLIRTIVSNLQAGTIPALSMTPQMQQVMMQQASQAMLYLQPRGSVNGIQLSNQQTLPDGVTLYQFQVQFTVGPMVWRLWLDQSSRIVGLHFT